MVLFEQQQLINKLEKQYKHKLPNKHYEAAFAPGTNVNQINSQSKLL